VVCFRYSVYNLCDFSVGDGMDRFAVTPPIFVASSSVTMKFPVGANFDPIDRESLRYVDVAVDRGDGATVVGVIGRALTGKPAGAFERRAKQWSWIFADRYRKVFEHSFRGRAREYTGRKGYSVPQDVGNLATQRLCDEHEEYKTLSGSNSLRRFGVHLRAHLNYELAQPIAGNRDWRLSLFSVRENFQMIQG
jgi:hypothetical protein